MKLNAIETVLMNNPARAALQRYVETELLKRRGGVMTGRDALEIGCGRGVGVGLILDVFGADRVTAIDLDPAMVARARDRWSDRPREQVRILQGDATQIPAEDASFDAVFDFGIIHHVPGWQRAVVEVARVLRPGGRFYFEEVTARALRHWLYRSFLDHPVANRFSGEQFVAELERCGVQVGTRVTEHWFGHFVVGVGERQGAHPLATAKTS